MGKNPNVCDLCDNRCHRSRLGCKRGVALFSAAPTHEKLAVPRKKAPAEKRVRGPEPPKKASSLPQQLMRCGSILQRQGGAGQERVLSLLRDNGPMGQRALQEMLSVRSGSLSELLAKLEGRGLIVRSRSEEDRRQSTVSLTDAGRAAVSGSAPDFSVLSEEEQEVLSSLLARLLDAWES